MREKTSINDYAPRDWNLCDICGVYQPEAWLTQTEKEPVVRLCLDRPRCKRWLKERLDRERADI